MQQNLLERERTTETILTSGALLEHWQGHRRLTRKLIEAFPEKELFTFSVGNMRPFAGLVTEMLDMAIPGLLGVVSGKWQKVDELTHFNGGLSRTTKEALLAEWDLATEKMNELWAMIPPARFNEHDLAFGQYEGTIVSFLFYFIDNEIHHRGQGYVYLRALGIEPPAFWDRY